ncbi:Acetylxylan esterase precursor [Thalassoglobus neptunius]|uniref:Acetylxylan esterase n=2 Tax=Thalassoglobus neptunius TaxID=1938619 RepID=A0A5C5X5E9_9PLAN|nr:Acetylxylan esterase precursor [Thalassoglobus neptunius]
MIGRLLVVGLLLIVAGAGSARSDDRSQFVDLWEGNAPGESTRSYGTPLPQRPDENPPATRITAITAPRIERFDPDPETKNGASVVILPGGGYRYCVVDKEGSEIAKWFNKLGVTAFVLRYRTIRESDKDRKEAWRRPVQDTQRAVRWVRSNSEKFGLDPNRIGVIGFSAGGNAAAITVGSQASHYPESDEIDQASCVPDFAMLIYPWNLTQNETLELIPEIEIDSQTAPTVLIHAHDDHSTSLGSIAFYAQLKRNDVPAELHIYETGGHGYGMRPVAGSVVATWPDRVEDWLRNRGLLTQSP